MSTILQIEANRRNAESSTGPRTQPGKAVSRFNALKTGIHARSHLIPGEDPHALESLTLEHYDRFQPAAPEQRFLVDAMISAEWQLRRLRKAEAQLWEYAMQEWRPKEKLVSSFRAFLLRADPLTLLHRRIDAAERSYYRALRQLLQLPSGHAAPAAAEAPPPPLSGMELPSVAALPPEPEPSPNQSPGPQIGFVPAIRPAASTCPRRLLPMPAD
ncbi:MAG: hypothetical protein ABSF25_15580 [Bryobacteraceae bacterium]